MGVKFADDDETPPGAADADGDTGIPAFKNPMMIYRGWLYKAGNHASVREAWKRRYFVCDSLTSYKYYADQQATELKGACILLDISKPAAIHWTFHPTLESTHPPNHPARPKPQAQLKWPISSTLKAFRQARARVHFRHRSAASRL